MRTAFRVLGWFCVAVAMVYALLMRDADRRLQSHRSPGVPPRRYALVPLRWARDIYRPDGAPIVDEAWRYFRRMVAAALAGMLLLAYTAE